MKKTSFFVLIAVMLSLSSCQLIGDIFKAGVWAGALMIIGVIALVFFLVAKVFSSGK